MYYLGPWKSPEAATAYRRLIAEVPTSPSNPGYQEEIDLFTRFIRLGSAAAHLRQGEPPVLARTVVLMLQALHNPLALGPGSAPVVEEVSRAVYRLLAPD